MSSTEYITNVTIDFGDAGDHDIEVCIDIDDVWMVDQVFEQPLYEDENIIDVIKTDPMKFITHGLDMLSESEVVELIADYLDIDSE